MFGINNNNQFFNKKSTINDALADISNRQERKDMYVPNDNFDDAGTENATYDQNGQLLNSPNQKNSLNEASDEIDYSKINGIVTPEYSTINEPRKMTEEETRLWNLSMYMGLLSSREYMQTQIELADSLKISCITQTVDELYAMYDKKFGTDSSDKVKYFNSLREQFSNVQQMLSSLQKALDAGKTRNDIMEFAPDDSFSKDDFDYIMNISDNYDYQNHELTNKDAIKTNNSNVSSDLSNVLAGMFS